MTAKHFSGAIIAVFTLVGARAQETTQPPVMDLAARKESVVTLETYITQREKRLAELGQDIVTLDGRIEKRVDELVKMLADMRDSQDSKRKVSQIKQEAIDGLKRGIDLYVAKRKEMREKVRTGGDEAALADLGKFDQRIFKRVDQIVELSKSFPAHKDVEKYQSEGGDYWNGYYYENTRISDDWKQNRRDNTQGKVTRDETIKTIREGLERLDQRRRSLKDLLANRNLTESARKLYTQEMGQIDAYTERLNSELVEASSPSSGGATRMPSLDEAIDVEQMLNDARKDLREDVSNLFRLYDEFDSARQRLNEMKENLAARKAWLEKNAAK